jgi:lactose/L-arabinose transport system permease protein
MKFVGLKNFVRLLNDERFLLSIRNMFILWLGHIFFLLILAFLVAVILDAPMIKGRSIYRTMVYLPNVTPIAVMGLVFGFIFEFNFGVLNSLLANIGFSAFPWLTDQNWIKVSIILVNLWGATGWYMIILLAGLQNIDATLYEAAEIDGAGSFQKLIFITLPSLKGLLFFCFLTETIGSFQLFTEPFILVGGSGGSQGGGLVPAMYMYQQAFEYSKMGYASALSLALFAIILVASLIQWRLMDRED